MKKRRRRKQYLLTGPLLCYRRNTRYCGGEIAVKDPLLSNTEFIRERLT